MPKKEEEPTLASLVGDSFALIQHGIDHVIDWGFSKMKESEKELPPVQKIKNPYLRGAAKAGRGFLGFIASAGTSYYKTYNELKKTDSTKQP